MGGIENFESPQLRVGVIGCGYWGSKHVRVLHSIEAVSQVVLIDTNRLRMNLLMQAFPMASAFESLADAIAADAIDAVVIASPAATHASVALEAIDAGLHVLIEKPFATRADDAQQMVCAAEAASVTLMAGHTFAYNSAVQHLRDVVRRNDLGEIHYLDAARLNLGLYQPDVNVIWDLAPHDISVANFVLGGLPIAVTAWGSRCATPLVEDVATLRLDYPGGVVATIRVSWLDPCKVRRTTVVGSRGMAVYNDMNDSERIKIYDRGVANELEDDLNPKTAHEAPLTYRYGDVTAPFVDFKEPLLVEDRHFVSSILDGTVPDTPGTDGVDVVKVLEAADRSIGEARTVSLDEATPALLARTHASV